MDPNLDYDKMTEREDRCRARDKEGILRALEEICGPLPMKTVMR